MDLRDRRWDVLVAALSFAGIVYFSLSLNAGGSDALTPYPAGFAVCGLLWVPGLLLLLARIRRQPPFLGEVL